MVNDEKTLLKWQRFIHDITGRGLKNSINLDEVMNRIRPMIGQGCEKGFHFLNDLLSKPYIAFFSDNVKKFSDGEVVMKKTLDSKPEKLGKVTTEREILKRLPGCADLSDDKLVEKAKTLLPSFDTAFGNIMGNINLSEEEGENLIPTKVGTWILSPCVHNGELQVLRCLRDSDGWDVHCHPVELGGEWSAVSLLLLAKETLAP